MNNIPDIKYNNNLKKGNNFFNENKNNLIFQNNSDLASISDINRNEISPLFNRHENNPRNIINMSNTNQNNQSINFSKFTNFVGNSNVSNQNITNNLTHINNNLNNQNNISNYKNIKKNNIPKIFLGNNYYQNIINNAVNKSSVTNISNKNMVQSYLSSERNDRNYKNNINDNKNKIEDVKKNENYFYNEDNRKINNIKPMINLSITYDEKENDYDKTNKNNNTGDIYSKNTQKFITVNENEKNNNIDKHNYFDSEKLIFTSKAHSKNNIVFNFNKDKVNEYLTDREYDYNNEEDKQIREVGKDNFKKSEILLNNNIKYDNNSQRIKTTEKVVSNNNIISINNLRIEDKESINNQKNLMDSNQFENKEHIKTIHHQNDKLINPKYNNFKLNIFEKLNKNPFLPNTNLCINNNMNINIKKNNKNNEDNKENDNLNLNPNKIPSNNNSLKNINNWMESKKSFETKSVNSQDRYAACETEENKKVISSNINYLNINSLELNKKKLDMNRNMNKEQMINEKTNYINVQENFYRNTNENDKDDDVCFNAVINLDESELTSNITPNKEKNLFRESNNNNNLKLDIENEKINNQEMSSPNFKTEKKNLKSNETKYEKEKKASLNKMKGKNQNNTKNKNLNSEKKNPNMINLNKNINEQRSKSKNINLRSKIINKNDDFNPKYHKSLNLQNKKLNKKINSDNINTRNKKISNAKEPNDIHSEKKKLYTITLPDEILFKKLNSNPEYNPQEDSLCNSFNKEFENILNDEKFNFRKNDSYDFSYSCKSMKNDLINFEKLEKDISSKKNKEKVEVLDQAIQNEIYKSDHIYLNKEDNIKNIILTTENSNNTNKNNIPKFQIYDTTKFSIEVKNSENFNRLKTEEKEDKIKLETVQEMNNVISKSVKLQSKNNNFLNYIIN